jgi:hypothetical protein
VNSGNQFWQEEVYEPMYVPKGMVTSPAFLALKTVAAHRVLMIFYAKRDMEYRHTAGQKAKGWRCVNNGQITFSYKEAADKYGLTASRFRSAIDELVEKGFIDIARSGYGLHKHQTLYAVSRRWERFGTPEFMHAKRPRRAERMGFPEGNTHRRDWHEREQNAQAEDDSEMLRVTVDKCYG